MEHWRVVGGVMLWALLVQIGCTAWVLLFEGGKLSRIAVHSLVLSTNNVGILAPVVLEAVVGPSAEVVGMLAAMVVYFQQLPFAMVLFEVDGTGDEVQLEDTHACGKARGEARGDVRESVRYHELGGCETAGQTAGEEDTSAIMRWTGAGGGVAETRIRISNATAKASPPGGVWGNLGLPAAQPVSVGRGAQQQHQQPQQQQQQWRVCNLAHELHHTAEAAVPSPRSHLLPSVLEVAASPSHPCTSSSLAAADDTPGSSSSSGKAAAPAAAPASAAARMHGGEHSLRRAVRLVLSNGGMWTTAAATAVSMLGLHAVLDPDVPSHVPELRFVEGTLAWLARCSVPISLFAMGLFMASRPGCGLDSGKSARTLLSYMGVRILVLPWLMVFVNSLLGLDGRLAKATVVLTCVPVAQIAFVLAEQYGEGAEAAANVMQMGLLLMLPHVAAMMALMRWWGLYEEA